MSKYDRMTDEQLLCDYKNGNQEIMDYLMVKYKSMVRKKARAMYLLGGENEDLIQEGMIGRIELQLASFTDCKSTETLAGAISSRSVVPLAGAVPSSSVASPSALQMPDFAKDFHSVGATSLLLL